MKRLSEKRRRSDLWVYFSSRPKLVTEVLFLFPLALIYHVGGAINGRLNGVDLVSVGLLAMDRYWPDAVLGLEIAVLAGFLGLWWWARRKEQFRWSFLGPVLAESAVYALTMGSMIVLILVKVFHMEPPAMAGGGATVAGWLDVVQVSSGAGFYEELIFRMLLFGGMAKLLSDNTNRAWGGPVVIALVVSSLLFSAAHHWPGGEDFAAWPFAYRTLAGMIFGLVYWYRGLSVAAYTHAFYDIMVLGSSL